MTLYTSALPTTLWQLIYPFINFTVHPRLLHFKNLSLTSPCSDPTHSYLGQLSAFTPKFICGQLHKPQFPMLSLPLHSLFPTEHHHELTTQVFWNHVHFPLHTLRASSVPVKCMFTESITPVSFVPHQFMLSLSLMFLPLTPSCLVPLSRLSPCIYSLLPTH